MIKSLVILVCALIAAPSFAATIFVGCNLKGLEKMTSEQQTKVFFNRLANNGRGNGGESINVLVDLASGNTIVTCVKTATEDTRGNLSVQIPGVGIVNLGPYWREVDPNGPTTP